MNTQEYMKGMALWIILIRIAPPIMFSRKDISLTNSQGTNFLEYWLRVFDLSHNMLALLTSQSTSNSRNIA